MAWLDNIDLEISYCAEPAYLEYIAHIAHNTLQSGYTINSVTVVNKFPGVYTIHEYGLPLCSDAI